MADSSPFASIGESLNRGEPIPEADVQLFAKYFHAVEDLRERMPQLFRDNSAVGVSGLGNGEFASLDPAELVSLNLRSRLLSSLLTSSELGAYVADESSREQVIRAGATVPCTLLDVACTFDDFKEAKGADLLREQGVRPFAERFLQWMQDSR